MIERKRGVELTGTRVPYLMEEDRLAVSAMDTLEALANALKPFAEGKLISAALIQSSRAKIDQVMRHFFMYPRQHQASISRMASLLRAHLTLIEGSSTPPQRGPNN